MSLQEGGEVILIQDYVEHAFMRNMIGSCRTEAVGRAILWTTAHLKTSCRSTPVRPSFIVTTQIKIFFDEIREVYDSSIDSNIINTFKVQKGTKDIVKTVECTLYKFYSIIYSNSGEMDEFVCCKSVVHIAPKLIAINYDDYELI